MEKIQPKNWGKKNCQNPFKAIIRQKKWHGPQSHKCREGKTLEVRPLKKKHFFLCMSSLNYSVNNYLKGYAGFKSVHKRFLIIHPIYIRLILTGKKFKFLN